MTKLPKALQKLGKVSQSIPVAEELLNWNRFLIEKEARGKATDMGK